VEATKSDKSFVDNAEEKTINFESGSLNLEISSLGMGIKKAYLNKYKDRQGDTIILGGANTDSYLFELKVNAPDLPRVNFNLEKKSDNEIVGFFKKGDME